MTTLQIAHTFATEQEIEKFVLSYLETHQEFLKKIVLPKFSLPKKTRRRKLPMVDAETEKRIGQALAEYKAGEYITVNPGDDILYALNNFDELLKIQKIERTQNDKV